MYRARQTRCFLPMALALGLGAFPVGLRADLVRIQGLATVPEAKAREWIGSQIQFVESAGVSRARADDLAFFLENALRDRGYSDATVAWAVEGSGGTGGILLTVSEGLTLMVGEIRIEGNETLEDDAVVELLTSPTRKRLRLGPADAVPYVRNDLEQGRKKLLSFYRLLGFRDADASISSRTEGRSVHLEVAVTEGTSATVGAITFPEPPQPELEAAFEALRTEFTGKNFSPAIAGNLASRVRAIAVDAGYFHARVTTDETESGETEGIARVDIAITADWGAPVVISGLRVHGNEKVRTVFFERQFRELLDRPYSPAVSNREVNELLQTGAFETVRTKMVEENGSHYLDIEVEEDYTRTLGIYGGFTNYDGPIAGFEFRHLNLFGLVRRLEAALELSGRGALGQVDYTDPWFLETDFEFKGGLFAVNRAEEGYEKFKTGGRYEFNRRLGRERKDTISLFGEAAYTDVHEAEIDPRFLGDREYFSHQVGLSFTHDRRDNPRNPRKGYLAQTSIATASSALGSDIEYWKLTGRLGYYLPVGDHTLRLGARAGMISPQGDTEGIPIDLRFFNGGPFSVRSFQERSLGLRDPASGYPVGGNFYTVFNAEYEIPVRALQGLSIVPFADAGNLIYDESDANLENLRYAVGLGLRYQTPIGPIRLEYGANPDARPGEPDGTFHVGFGLGY